MSATMLVCGCPADYQHREDCWLATAEDAAISAVLGADKVGGHALVSLITTLAERGLIRDIEFGETLWIVDLLADLEIVHPPAVAA